jgi:hypothetical protein
MFRLLQKLLGTSKPSSGRRGAGTGPDTHRVRPKVEALEDRLALSTALAPDLVGVPGRTILPTHSHLLTLKLTDIQGPFVLSPFLKKLHLGQFRLAVPNLSNFTFALVSENGSHHQLAIHNQVYENNGTARIDGLWDQANPVGGVQGFGLLEQDGQGIHITFAFNNHLLDGHITSQGVVWHLDGQVEVANGSGPGHVVGDSV